MTACDVQLVVGQVLIGTEFLAGIMAADDQGKLTLGAAVIGTPHRAGIPIEFAVEPDEEASSREGPGFNTEVDVRCQTGGQPEVLVRDRLQRCRVGRVLVEADKSPRTAFVRLPLMS